jgi:hypothetical protein
MSKLTHFAHPRGWTKGEPMLVCESGSGCPALMPIRIEATSVILFLAFTNEDARKQWLKWWRKP